MLAVVAIVVGLSLLGYIDIRFKSPQQRTVTAWHVCGSADVTKYNEAVMDLDEAKKTTRLKEVADSIEKYSNAKHDATCNYILLKYAMLSKNTTQVNQAFNDFKESIKTEGVYASSELRGLEDRKAIEGAVESYNNSQNNEKANSDEANG